MRLSRPRLFVSYAREDEAHALRLYRLLTDRGYRVFVDTQNLLIGDHFMSGLYAELEKSDALLFLHTRHSATSEWCRAEVYAAATLGLQLLRIRRADAGALPDPMERMLSAVHYLPWQDEALEQIDTHLDQARRRALRRVALRSGAAIGAFAGLLVVALLFFSRWESWQTAQKRASVLASIEQSRTPWTAGYLEAQIGNLQRDAQLLSQVRAMRDDPDIRDTAPRLNAWQVDQFLSHRQERFKREDWSGLNWQGASLKESRLIDVTIRDGRVEDLAAEDCKMAGVYLGPGPG